MYWTALFLGFIGSLHCVVMCGPIALALAGQQSLSRFVISRLLYNFGRIITYAFIGLAFGLIGEVLFLGSYQQIFSVLMGSLMIIMAIALSTRAKGRLFRPLYYLTQKLKFWLQNWLKSASLNKTFLLGTLNGFLPCGLVYAAVAGAITTANISNGLVYMIVFGLGTIPAMLFMAITGQTLKGLSFSSLNRVSTIFVFTLGLLLIIRGMDLNIPYISPAISLLYPAADITICN